MQTPKQVPKLIIGLGNPGPAYENTYHNAGILFVEYLDDLKSDISTLKTVKSAVFMNVSGPFVQKTMKKGGVRQEALLIAHDDSDLYIGDWKLSFDRGAAGHKGVDSIIKTLGTKQFWRARIGIRPEAKMRKKSEEFVLKNITKTNKEKLEKTFGELASELKILGT